ncbi:MAG: CPBP family glutamic-type intramembrane protease [Geminicoccaceae bacterium]
MATAGEPAAPAAPAIDFPYVDGKPVALSAGQWWLVMAAVLAAYLMLILPPPFLRGTFSGFVPALLYALVPLAALALVAGRHWRALFRPIRGRDILLMIGFALLNLLVTLGTGLLILRLTETTANAAMQAVATVGGLDRALLYVRAAPQLLGEELMSVLPFLALLTWLCGRRGLSRRAGIALATLAVAVLFAAAHLPTYGWNVVQALLGVGVARIVLLVPFILTRNVLVCTGAHILNDWLFFTIFAASAPAA